MNNPIFRKHILNANQFTKVDIDYVVELTGRMKHIVETEGGIDLLKHKILAALFYEPSSRTFSSFITAIQRLGGGFIPLNNMDNTSVKKGESFPDTIQTFSNYADVLVIRHPEIGAVAKVAEFSNKPILNAGDGIGEHPTQCFQDIFTMKSSLGKVDGLHIVMVGDLGHYRNVNSLAKGLVHYKNIKITFVSPSQVKIQEELREFLKDHHLNFSECESLAEVIADADVLYVTRVKKEYMTEELYSQIQGKYIIDKKIVEQMKKNSIIMHPFPRLGEIAVEVDQDIRAVYIREQMKNGMYTRMALLASVLLPEIHI